MIQTEQKNAVILQDGEEVQDSIKMSLDLESASEIMQILSKNLYSDAIGSTVRETVSNALDSHRRAGVTDQPIVVTFKPEGGNYQFTVEDFGTGLNHDEVFGIISKYGKSTKRQIANELGYFGLGWKAPLSYTPSFTFIARKDGIERKYMMCEGEDENQIDLLDENSTTAPNGVKIIVSVNYYDRNNFYNKIREQLCYFENVYFDVSYGSEKIDNDFKITRYTDFQLSEINQDGQMHICLDNIYYPLDFKKLGIDAIQVPVGLRFNLSDGLYPTPNREAIRMNQAAKDIILDKIKKVASEIVGMYNKTIQDTDDIKTIIQYYKNSSKYLDIGHKKQIEISPLDKYSNVKIVEPRLNGINLLNLRKLFTNIYTIDEYTVQYHLHYGKMRERKHDGALQIDTCLREVIYKFTDRVGGRKKEYIKTILPNGYRSAYFVKTKARKLFSSTTQLKSYYSFLDLHMYARSQWRDRIKEWQTIVNLLTKGFIDVDAIDIPKAWIDARKVRYVGRSKAGHQKLTGEISCKKAENLERYVDGKDCKMVPFSVDLGKLPQQPILYIYDSHENSAKLDKLFMLSKEQKNIKFITFSDRELKRLNEGGIHNLISYDEFMKGNTKPFKRIVTAYLIYTLTSKFRSTFNQKDTLKNVSLDLSNKLKTLNGYKESHYSHSGSDKMYEAMVEVANKYGLYDNTVYPLYEEVKELLEKFPFIETVCSYIRYNGDDLMNVLTDLFKYHKHKVNIDKYKLKINDEDLPEMTEQLEQEVVDELVNN
jgi:hypothetical protein